MRHWHNKGLKWIHVAIGFLSLDRATTQTKHMNSKNEKVFEVYTHYSEVWLWSMEDQASKVLQSFDRLICILILIVQGGGWGGEK